MGTRQGTVKTFNAEKGPTLGSVVVRKAPAAGLAGLGPGFGFIAVEDGGPDVFLHVKQCVGSMPKPGDVVTYDVEPSINRPGQMVAKNVTGGSMPLATGQQAGAGYGPVRTDVTQLTNPYAQNGMMGGMNMGCAGLGMTAMPGLGLGDMNAMGGLASQLGCAGFSGCAGCPGCGCGACGCGGCGCGASACGGCGACSGCGLGDCSGCGACGCGGLGDCSGCGACGCGGCGLDGCGACGCAGCGACSSCGCGCPQGCGCGLNGCGGCMPDMNALGGFAGYGCDGGMSQPLGEQAAPMAMPPGAEMVSEEVGQAT